MASTEPPTRRWGRRVRTIPTMLLATAAGLLLLPVALPTVVVADLLRGRRRLPLARLSLFLVQYGINDSIEILLSPWLWARSGFGLGRHRRASMDRYARVQRWSVDLLARRAEQLLGLRIAVDDATTDALAPGPVLVLCRHVSVFDSALPDRLYEPLGFRPRGVLMAELLADPGFDLIYPNAGSVFIDREDGPAARRALTPLAHEVDDTTAIVIYPEGRLFRPERLASAIGRLERDHPERAARLAPLRSVLPPRPAGTLALLDLLPTADVVVIAHRGLERHGTLASLAAGAPVDEPVEVTAWRVSRREIPTAPDERIVWLDEQWLRMDRWVGADRADGAVGDVS